MIFQAILAAALAFPPHTSDRDEPEPERAERITVIAQAIDSASARATCFEQPAGCKRVWPGSRKELAVLLLTIAKHESELARRIHAGQCRKLECDRGKATSLWQLHASDKLPRSVWATLAGTDLESTTRAAWYASVKLAAYRFRCAKGQADWLEPTIAGYARGNWCSWDGAAKRAKTFRRLMATQ